MRPKWGLLAMIFVARDTIFGAEIVVFCPRDMGGHHFAMSKRRRTPAVEALAAAPRLAAIVHELLANVERIASTKLQASNSTMRFEYQFRKSNKIDNCRQLIDALRQFFNGDQLPR
jgi:hypothetical protein